MNQKSSETVCALPWTHVSIDPNGRVLPCCLTTTKGYAIGNINNQSLDQIWNSDRMKSLRLQMINGDKPTACDTCWKMEASTGTSDRIKHNNDFKDVIDRIPDTTLSDGTCTEFKLKYWDFRFSNKCNFKCRSCGSRYSSAWAEDESKLFSSKKQKLTKIDCIDNKPNYTFIQEHIDHVEKIYFAGGEPMLMDEHWQIIELLVNKQRFDVELYYSTNCSTLVKNGKCVTDYWKLWKPGKITIMPSIDEIGERAELLRSGTVWNRVESNLLKLVELTNVSVRPAITVGLWNVFRLPEIVSHLIDIGVISKKYNYTNWYISILYEPKYFNVSVLPYEYKQQIIKQLNIFAKKFNIDNHFKQVIEELNQPQDTELVSSFIDMSDKLDVIRDENIYKIIPELQKLKDEYIKNKLPEIDSKTIVAYINKNIQNKRNEYKK